MWKYKGKNIKSLKNIPEGAYGFIYLIEVNFNNQKRFYLGKKNLFFERKVNLTKKEIEQLPNKRLKKYKYVVKESDWLEYTGSNIQLNEHIKEGAKIKKTILEFCFSKRELTYKEVKYLFKYEVLEKEEYYNENINRMWFKGNIK